MHYGLSMVALSPYLGFQFLLKAQKHCYVYVWQCVLVVCGSLAGRGVGGSSYLFFLVQNFQYGYLMLITTQGLLYSHAIRKKNGKRQNRGCLVWAANHNVLPCSRTTADQEIPMRSVNHTFCIFAICVLVFSYFLNVSFAALPSSLARETSHNCIHCNLRSYNNYCSR